MVKTYCEEWSKEEIEEYVDAFGILILFKKHGHTKEAEVVVHGDISDKIKWQLKEAITLKYGGKTLTADLGLQINILAEQWYSKFVSKKPLYVLNY